MATKTVSRKATNTSNNNPNSGYEKLVKAIGLMVTGFIAYRVIKNLNEPQRRMSSKNGKIKIISRQNSLKGREWRLYYVNTQHFVTGNKMFPPFPSHLQLAMFAMGSFCSSERLIHTKLNGIYATNVGYADGFTHNPTYKEIKSDKTGHNEVVRIIFDPKIISYSQLLIFFFENHDMTLSMEDYQDTYHRSVIYCYNKKQKELANKCLNEWRYICKNNERLKNETIYTEIKNVPDKFYYAEEFYQSYMHKNPDKLDESIIAQGIGIKFSEEFVNQLNEMEVDLIEQD